LTNVASSHEEDRQWLLLDISLLEATCTELRGLLLRNTQSTVVDGTQHRERVEALEEELSRCRTQYQKLEEKMQSMIETPQGLCKRAHRIRMKSLDELASGSGYLKRRQALLRVQLAPSIITKVQCQNRKNGKTPFPLKWKNSKSQILQNGSNRCTISCYLARIKLNLVECILNLG
jgi:hypothetical protein